MVRAHPAPEASRYAVVGPHDHPTLTIMRANRLQSATFSIEEDLPCDMSSA